ncbi:DUF5999 family protein [Micromonospora sp. NPDC047074]|uniref:DUF5999 family protein n=1 Tax=Micromonospora sp. NPDC047074 TaxID=3154339 RepID=UPI0033CDBF07
MSSSSRTPASCSPTAGPSPRTAARPATPSSPDPTHTPSRTSVASTQASPPVGTPAAQVGAARFEDTGELLPDGRTIAPHRGPARHALVA